MAHRRSDEHKREKEEGTELEKQGRTKTGVLVREGKGEDRKSHGLVSADLRLVVELSCGMAK